LPEFRKYDVTITLNDVIALGLKIAAIPDNLIGIPSSRQVFEQAVILGGKTIRVRVVLNSLGKLRSVHIRKSPES
jgi:hypothetical protein